MFEYDRDILIRDAGLWLDARRKKDFAFVSHAHGDHTGRHARIIATPATFALAAERDAVKREAKGLKPPRTNSDETAVEFGEDVSLGDVSITLYPAGHILGSAQILVRRNGSSLLYSGDFCLETTAAAEDIQIPKADTLIMECTYGLPEHRFPPREEVVEKVRKFVDASLSSGRTPVLLCYALGKGQEVVRILGQCGYPVAVEDETYRLAKVYERFGVAFESMRRLDSAVAAGEVVVTPSLDKVSEFLAGRRVRTAAVTGWAVGSFGYRARRAHTRIPLSDHADFHGLLNYVEAVNPQTVYVVHGPSEFSYYLRKAGFNVGSVRDKAPPAGVRG